MEARQGNASDQYPTKSDCRNLENGSYHDYLKNSCVKYFDSILRHSPFHEQNYLRDQTQNYLISRGYQPDQSVNSWSRLRQSVMVSTGSDSRLVPGSRETYDQSSNEYQVYVLQSGSYPDPDQDPFYVRDLVWRDETALIITPASNETSSEVYVVDQLTGEEIDEEKLTGIVEMLYAWDEKIQQAEPVSSCYDKCLPGIKLCPDEEYHSCSL